MVGLVDGNNFYVSCERVFDRSLVGKPVAVLSNNDGCCVAMSSEFKALGIARGTPYFQLKDRERSDGLIFRSSNYELYGDISRRIVSILRDMTVDVEQYSIDEAFITPPNGEDLKAYGTKIRERILRWVGIPCGVGFAPTKTLAKIANHIGKKLASGVFVMSEDPTDILAKLPTSEVWGVGRRLPIKLRAERIHTAKDLRDAPDEVLRSIGGITLVRVATELRGIPCHEERDLEATPDSVSCSRCFGEPVATERGIIEAVASFTAQAATKLRKHKMLASGCNIYVQEAPLGEFFGRTVLFRQPTDATNEMLQEIAKASAALFVEGRRYRKAGVVFLGLEKSGAIRQMDLFSPVEMLKSSSLYEVIDRLNMKYGKNSIRSASQGLETQNPSWTMKRAKLSFRATTSWKELPVVR